MTELDLLRTIDPAADAPDDEQAAGRLLRTVLAEPRPGRRRRRARRRLLVAVPAAAALVIAIPVALDTTSHGGGGSLADKAYAATNPADEIIHEVGVTTVPEPYGSITETQESWSRPADGTARAIQSGPGGKPTELVIDADGTVHLHSPYAVNPNEMIVPAGTQLNDVMSRWLDGVRSVTLGFRDDYAGKQLRDDGMTTLDGRSVHAYSTDTSEYFFEDHAYATFHRTFYIDPDTTLPIGERVEMPGPNGTPIVSTTVVRSYEKLPATPENLAKLR